MPTKQWVDAALKAYGLTSGVVVSPTSQGDDNESLFVSRADERFVLRRYGVTPAEEVQFELDAIDYLGSVGFPTPRLIRTPEGKRALDVEGASVVLFDFVSGSPISDDDSESGPAVARLAARMHKLTAGQTFGGRRSRTDLYRIGAFTFACQEDPLLRAKPGAERFAEHGRALLAEAPEVFTPDLPRGLIHHDMHSENVLVEPHGEIVGLIDFDESYSGPFVLDIAGLLHSWARGADFGYDIGAARRTLAAYREVRNITTAEQRALGFALRVFHAADASEYILRNYRHRPATFDLGECHSLAGYYKITGGTDWLANLED
ncbi:phosphotransferase [Phytoactinopolyspora endophytica]|uniref:phosphotransferase n=1 Tax=Phytoactinopolyspora endophytica TaxID=1642495 RepID=UPI00101C4F22|nr:phosphotransferase [Phytoactinopolyspora endophytica]